MGEATSQSGIEYGIGGPLVCYSCGYDLSGLPMGTVCPECAAEIQTSLHIAIEAKYGTDPRRLPLPSWLRIAKSAYMAGAVFLLLAPWVLPNIAEVLGLPADTGRHSQFPFSLASCCVPAVLFGFVLGALLAGSGSRWSLVVLCAALGLLLLGWQSILAW